MPPTLIYRTVGNFRGVLIFVDFVGPTQTTKNSLKICFDPRKYSFLGLKTTNLSLVHIMHIAMLFIYCYTGQTAQLILPRGLSNQT